MVHLVKDSIVDSTLPTVDQSGVEDLVRYTLAILPCADHMLTDGLFQFGCVLTGGVALADYFTLACHLARHPLEALERVLRHVQRLR